MAQDPIEAKLAELGLAVPPPPSPAGSYVPFRIAGKTLYISGVLPTKDGKMSHVGQVPSQFSIEQAQEAAQLCALNTLASIKLALGELSRVKQFLLVTGFVNGVANFDASPQVINGASDLFVKIYGDAGKHARAAVAAAGLPRGAAVEIQVTVEFE